MSDQYEKRQDRLEGLLRQLFPARPEPEHPIEALWKQLSVDALVWINNQSRYRDIRDDFEAMEALTHEALKMEAEGTLPPRYSYTPPPEPPAEPEHAQTARAPELEPTPDLEPERESTPGRFGLRPAEPTLTAPWGLPPTGSPRVVDLQGRPVRQAPGPGLPLDRRR